MAENNIEGTSSHVVSSTKSFQSSVGPNLIKGTDEDYCNNLHKTVTANLLASVLQEHPMSLVLAENKNNLQEISVEQKIPTGVSINISSVLQEHFTIEVDDGIPSSSSKANEPMEAQDDSNTVKSNTASCMFEASEQQECPVGLILTDKTGNLQEVSVEKNVPCGDYVALSTKADSNELTSTNEVTNGFLTCSSKAYESKEAQDDSTIAKASDVNVCAASYSTLCLIEGVQDKASCIDSGKVTCETPRAILNRAKGDKPLVVHRFHKRQMSLGDTRQEVPAPLSRSNTSKNLRMDKTIVDTTTPIESVKAAASKFGGSINWKTRRTAQESDHTELDKLKNEISECKHQAEAAEAANLSVLNELERTKKLIIEMKHALEMEQAEEVDVMDDLELVQFILQVMEGVTCNDSVVVGEKLINVQGRHKALVAKVMSVKDELRKLQEDYNSLLIETNSSISKAQAAVTMSKDAEKEVEELTIELQRLKEVFNLANTTCQDVEERKKNMLIARDEDCLAWEKDLRQSANELNQISLDLCTFQELQSKHDASAIMLLSLKNELAACLEAKLIEEAREQESGTHKPTQEEVITMLKSELEEHRKSIAKVTDELRVLKATAALLKSQLKKEKAALAATQQAEAMASITIQSLKMDIKLSRQELEAVHAKAKECRDRMDKVLHDASREADKAKAIATKSEEELRKTREEVEQAKAALSTVEFRLEAVLRDIQEAKESERLALNTLTTLEADGKAAVNAKQCSSQMITLDFNDYTSLTQKSRQAEEAAHEKTAAAIARVEAAKESASRALSRLNEISKALEEQKQALTAATEQEDRATEGKLAMEQDLRKWREENGKRRRRKASEASKPEARRPSTVAVTEIVGGDTWKCTGKDDGCVAASVHPVSDASGSGRSSPNDVVKAMDAKKVSFFPRVIMFLGCWAGGASESELPSGRL